LKWDAAGNLIQDTFITLANDYGLPAGESMLVQLYFVRTCNAWVDATIKLTGDEPTYWSAYTGNPKGVQPFTALSDGIEDDTDLRNPGGKRLRGYILAWAINNDGQEINWNHLTGSAMIINYLDADAWEYESWGFQAVDADSIHGGTLREPFGQIDLDTVEYEAPPAMLLLDFYGTGAMLWSHDEMTGQFSPSFVFDTDLTLWPPIKDLREKF
ncbi:MAG: hypothetical protein KJ749_02070, partial [Planctomycetes bacterium]|nr:hypothetical protein [Planctomycetota bacterium]